MLGEGSCVSRGGRDDHGGGFTVVWKLLKRKPLTGMSAGAAGLGEMMGAIYPG